MPADNDYADGTTADPGRRTRARASEPTTLRTLRRADLRRLVPVADTTIYEMERRGEFPRRFHLTPRCVVWNLAEIEAWLTARQQASAAGLMPRAPTPDGRTRRKPPAPR
jgi:prophage regulatory protein